MNYNFTDRVRKVLALAREEAIRLQHDYVGTEHILLGLIREGEGVAAAVGVRITSRWLPWTADGRDPVDWVGIDGSGRAVVGLQRASLGTSSVPAILTGCHRVAAEREPWAPGSATRRPWASPLPEMPARSHVRRDCC